MNLENNEFDAVIIGAGPAGLSAAIWCRDLGLKAVILEKGSEPGGQLLQVYNPITNYPGVRTANGREMRDLFMETARSYGVDVLLSTEIVGIETEELSVITASGGRYGARAIILATGVRRRRLNIPGEAELAGKGIIESGSRDKDSTRGQTVAIVGGGDAAVENALILADHAERVYVIHRKSALSARDEFVKRAVETRSVEFVMDTAVTRINGSDSVESVELTDQKTKATRTLSTDRVLIRIGVEPNSQLLAEKADLDPNGYVLTNPSNRTSAAGIYAVGDVANPIAPTISTAAGDGASAGKAIHNLLTNKKPL